MAEHQETEALLVPLSYPSLDVLLILGQYHLHKQPIYCSLIDTYSLS